MMKKIFAVFAIVSVMCSLSAQKVSESVTIFGKDQLSGFTTTIENTTMDIVENALADKFETQFGMKGSKKKGFRVYESQPCSAFGESRYDIYFTTAEIGKKKDRSTQVILVVSTGNLNCVTFNNDPRTSRNIVTFLEALPYDVEAYKIKMRINTLETELANLKKERESIEKNRAKVNEKINKANDEAKKLSNDIEKKTAEIEKLQDNFNHSQDATVKDQISKAVKEKQTLLKTQSNNQKSLLNLNNETVKLNKKLEEVTKAIEEKEAELKKLK